MIQWLKQAENPTIARFIECYWFIEKDQAAGSEPFPQLNPDPSAHLMLSPSKQFYGYQSKDVVYEGRGSHWIFPHSETFILDHSKPFQHLGIKFHAGALYSLVIPEYSHPSLNSVSSLGLSHLQASLKMDETMLLKLAQTDSQGCVEQLDSLLMPWLVGIEQDKHSELSQKALLLLDSSNIADLGERLFCSQRTLERSFARVTGLSLKQVQSMNKLEALLEYLYQRGVAELDWVDIAYRFGFSDQPHLIRHLKKQIGLTPKRYAEQRGLTIDVYGGVAANKR
ncbi:MULTISPECIES: helix-turn-helix domain-containing protein [unclassified Agarivorans]|uniref:helix-turn-helix domain-containing protein n=1 Tax=unclassified Agarivorans TaxID=2636026 RepID=UPI0026E20758|nr:MULTISPECIES: helix-turn-helix domain-containing protein [unclassified Agarivorans]MDO6687998.1 helix-turn-helix domain-containing protein [Agarivorans sp. 3_MG-2023]MDO6717585.1 helix-turn-helix domain-containing protein [Agarivorans sp. 2_MG-2023]